MLAVEDGTGAVITVGDDADADFLMIQDAIDAADEGDVIRVWEGTYNETVVVNKSVSLVGNSSANTTITTEGKGDGVHVMVDWVNITGFRISNSNDSGEKTGIKVQSDHNRIFDCDISDNKRYGIYISNHQWNDIYSNTFSRNDYGIYLISSSHNNLTNNTYSNNLAGIRARSSESITISNNTCFSNIEYGIYLLMNSDRNIITNNTCSKNGYAIYLSGSDNNEIHYNKIHDNRMFGIRSSGESMIDAERNYWGSADGPSGEGSGSGDSVSTNVDYEPWYATVTTTLFSECVMVMDNPRKAYSDTIQGGIDAASNGDIITVSAGIYYENILINKAINLTGAKGEVITIDGRASGDVVRITADRVSVTEFNIRNGSKDWPGHGASIRIESDHNYILENNCSHSYYGILFNTSNENTLSNNTITKNVIGLYLSNSSKHNIAQYNNIFNNELFGINASSNDGYYVIATANWWGHSSGPFHLSNNTNGKGDNISDHAKFDPWLNTPFDQVIIRSFINFVTPNPALETAIIRFIGSGISEGEITSYVWRSSIDGDLYNGTNSSFEYLAFSCGIHTIYLKVQNSTGTWSEETSSILTITQRPEAYIVSIYPNPWVERKPIYFNGSGSDEETITRYVWRSSVDGEFYNGTGDNITCNTLSTGSHTIFLKIKDAHGFWSKEVNTSSPIFVGV